MEINLLQTKQRKNVAKILVTHMITFDSSITNKEPIIR